jgi:DNA (cytosine-5)-methyltransferase 1
MTAYYNEFDPFAAAWLRELIKAGHIAPGDVDERSITEVTADDLRPYTQCHFFAGIGGWSYALRLALWPDDRPVWTGSPPCQDYSTAGRKARQSGKRHLWPHFARLIGERKPTTIFGEQVASAIAAGWWDDVANDLEAAGYSVAAAVLPACSADSPHERNRAFFVGYSGYFEHRGRNTLRQATGGIGRASEASQNCWIEGQRQIDDTPDDGASMVQSPWATAEWHRCADGLSRPVEPGILPVAYGVPNRMEALSGYGNAIVPQVAAEFIRAVI